MIAFLKHMTIQFKLGLRDKTLLIDFYIVPLGFYLIMGSVMSSINPQYMHTLITSLIAFGVTMGALQGVSAPLSKLREGGTLRSYRVIGIPEHSVLLTELLSTFLHLLIMSVIILVTAPIFFKADYPKNFILFFAVLFLFILATTAAGMLIGVIFSSHMAAMFSTVVFVFSVMVSGMMFEPSMLPKVLMYIGRILPATYAVQAFNGLAFGISTDFSAAIAISALTASGVVCGIFCVVRFIAMGRESV